EQQGDNQDREREPSPAIDGPRIVRPIGFGRRRGECLPACHPRRCAFLVDVAGNVPPQHVVVRQRQGLLVLTHQNNLSGTRMVSPGFTTSSSFTVTVRCLPFISRNILILPSDARSVGPPASASASSTVVPSGMEYAPGTC